MLSRDTRTSNLDRMMKSYYRKNLLWICGVVLLLVSGRSLSVQEDKYRSRYLEYARSSADWTWAHQGELIETWKRRFERQRPSDYCPPPGLLETAVIYAFLHEKETDPKYADRARNILLTYGDFRSYYLGAVARRKAEYEDGVPALPNFFTTMRYIRAYHTLRRLGALSDRDRKKMEGMIAHSVAFLLRASEWGPMNRAALRAETLAWAVKALPGHPEARIWEMQRKALGDDNWGNWEIEDSSIYHGIWLYAMLGYAEVLDRKQALMKTPEMYYYARYFLHLMCPYGMIPDFGDADWTASWACYLAYFEAAAAHYRDPGMKWAAETIARKFVDFSRPDDVELGHVLLDGYRWGTDAVTARPPESLSREVMEDVQGKKIVFRDGWKSDSTYLLLNYRDEGDGGLNFRDYLRDTIPVEEEKMTHGHADENSIVLLMSGGSVLLHDGGYRDIMPSGPYGAYRQDYYHNRLCVRQEKIWMGQKKGEHRYSTREAVPGQSVFEFLRNAGSYRSVRTRKVDFLSLPEFDYSRTRLMDGGLGYEWDRVITYVKDPGIFVVFDIFKSRKEDYYTLVNLWHSRKILSRGQHWYDTVYDQIEGRGATAGTCVLPDDRRLLLLFPSTHFRLEGVEKSRRHGQDELSIHQTAARHFELGDTEGFITVLIPHAEDVAPATLVERIRLLKMKPENAGLGVVIESGDRRITVGVKRDLRMDICRDWRRPRYTFEAGRIRFGEVTTNGDFIFTSHHENKLSYTIVNLTRALHDKRVLFEAKPVDFGLAFDASPGAVGRTKVRYWRDTVRIQ